MFFHLELGNKIQGKNSWLAYLGQMPIPGPINRDQGSRVIKDHDSSHPTGATWLEWEEV